MVNAQRPVANINLSDLEIVNCPECDHNLFNSQNRLRFLPRLMSPKGNPMWITEPVYVCAKCGRVSPHPAEWEKKKTEAWESQRVEATSKTDEERAVDPHEKE